MLKRLLVAVFVLGLLLAFSSTAFSTDQLGRQPKSVLHPKPEVNLHPDNRLGSVYPWNQVAPANHRALSTIRNAPGTEESQATASPDTTLCGNIDYLHIPGFYTYIMQAGDWTDRVALSYDVPVNYQTTLSAVRLRTYQVNGSPSITVQIHSDNLGNPGAVVYSQTFGPFAPLAYPGHTKVLTLATPQTFTEGSFWVSIGQTGLPTDSVGIGINRNPDSTTTGRGRYSLDGTTYMTFQGVGFSLDWDPRIAVTRCDNWSQCYSHIIDPRGMFGVVMPDDAYPDGSTGIGLGQRFVAAGPETLKAVKVMVVDEQAFGLPGHFLYGPTSTNGFVANLWTDSSGSIDVSSGPIFLGSIPGGLANIFPTTDNNGAAAPLRRDTFTIVVPGMPVLLGPYHITIEPTSPLFADGAPIFRFGVDNTYGGGSAKFTAPGITDWHLIANDPVFCPYNTGAAPYDGSVDIRPQLCKSEYSVCQNQKTYDAPYMWDYGMAAGSNIVEWAHLVKASPVNRVEKLRFQVDGVGTVGLTAKIWSKSPAGPGVLLYSQAVASPTFNPGWTEVVIPGGVQVLGDFYIGYEGIFPAPGDILYGETEDFYLTSKNGGAWLNYLPAGGWIPITVFGYFDNLMAEAEFCSIPVDERICVSENDWPTFQHDFARTGASGTAVGSDAYCDLTLNWSHIQPTGRGILLNGPIIWNSYVICAFSSATAGSYVIFNLATGAIVDEIDDPTWGADNSVIGGNIRCTPAVATVDIDPTGGVNLQPVLLIVGGNPGSVSAFDLSAGFPLAVPASKLWTFTDGGNIGTTRYGNLIVLNMGGTDVVYVAADDNKVYAINASTGASFAGWATPYTLTYNSQKAGATDGNNLFYSLFNTVGNSKVTAIKASDGTLAWDFTGLQGAVLFTGVTSETFEAGVSTADGEVYANSRILDGTPNLANFSRGVFYRLNATTGAMLSAAAGERARTTTPAIDANLVIVNSLPRVTGASATGGQVLGFSRADGSLAYSTSSFFSAQNGGQMGYFIEGLLTCEPDSADFYYVFNIAGYLSCFNADNGNESYHRRIDHSGANQGGMGAVGKDGSGDVHLVYVDAFGGIYDMTEQTPRARLELLSGGGAVAVPFGSPADTVVEFPDMYTNTGCVNLVVTMTASTTSNGTTVPAPGFSSINSRLDKSSSSLADMLSVSTNELYSQAGDIKRLGRDLFSGSTDELPSYVNNRQTYNRSAAAVPAFLVDAGGGDVFDPTGGGLVLAPGDTAGIRVHAVGPLVNRGPNSFYVEYTTHNDPDYFLNDASLRPEVFLSLVGGCLADTTSLHFGAGGANLRLVTNTSMLGKADFNPPTYGFDIDGMIDIMFAGTVAYGVSERRLAFHANAWDGSANEWISSQADPNNCDLSCKPNLTSSVALGDISTDGIAYVPITGRVVCKSMIDSVQNFDLGAGWDWSNFGAPFDNDSTMGLGVNARAIGVVDAPPAAVLLNNMTLDIWDVFNRSSVNSVLNWKIGAYNDNDIRAIHGGAYDTTIRDAAHSVGWSTSITGVAASGFVKIPFGCGYVPLKNIVSAVADEWVYIPDWDTAYVYMNKPAGSYDQGVFTSPQDEGSWYTFTEHDFAPSDTITFGYAFFAFDGLTNAFSSTADGKIANTADLVNKWAGFGRGDVNNDGVSNLADVVYLATHVSYGGPGPIPFRHLGDANASGGLPNVTDVQYLVDFYFNYGPCPAGAFVL